MCFLESIWLSKWNRNKFYQLHLHQCAISSQYGCREKKSLLRGTCLKKTKDIQATHSSCHESFIHLDTVGPGLGDKCIFKRKAAKMLCWNFAPWIFCEGRQQPRLQLECCRGSLWRNTDMNPPQEVVRSPRQQPQPGCFFASPLPEAPKQWNSWVGEKWETMWWQTPVRRNRRATFEHSGEGVVPWVHVLVLHPGDVESTLAGMQPAGNVWGKLIIKTLCKASQIITIFNELLLNPVYQGNGGVWDEQRIYRYRCSWNS